MTIDYSRQEEFAVIRLNRPEALNALSFGLIRELDQALDQVARSGARSLLLIGAGEKAFCAGADIAELANRSLTQTHRDTRFGQSVFSKIEDLPMPSVAIINGYAFGGGLELALACSFRLATANAKLGLPEIKLGLIPGYGATQRLPRVVGPTRALEMIMSGKTLDAATAVAWGLVSRMVEGDALAAGMVFAREFSGFSLPVLKLARQAVQDACEMPLPQGLKTEADLSTLAYQTADAAEGMAAFLAKRMPQFKDA
ncbi:MAG: enoyl-CoA hydratase-related protein [Burkholderiaceae bacterium]